MAWVEDNKNRSAGLHPAARGEISELEYDMTQPHFSKIIKKEKLGEKRY